MRVCVILFSLHELGFRKGLYHTLHCSVPGRGISGLLRFGVLSPLPSMLLSFQGDSKRFKAFHFNPEEAAPSVFPLVGVIARLNPKAS